MDLFFSYAGLFPIFFSVVFLMIFGVVIANIISGIKRMKRDKASPRLTVEARVVAKRMDVRTHRNGDNINHRSTIYYATFQVESGDRIELSLDGSDYGLLVEGDSGRLSFQGSRFLSFERS